jgi:hypothetical protein
MVALETMEMAAALETGDGGAVAEVQAACRITRREVDAAAQVFDHVRVKVCFGQAWALWGASEVVLLPDESLAA